MIYLFTEYEQITDEVLAVLIDKLPAERKAKAMRSHNKGVRTSCVLGYLLFLYGYRNLHRKKGSPDWAIAESGKPYLLEFPNIFFNISHCIGACACMFGNTPVGIDIQDCRNFRLNQALRTCSEEEVQTITSSPEPQLEFCRIWSIKESVSKLTGEGIFRDIRSVNANVTNCKTSFVEPDKYMTAASLDPYADFSIHRLTVSDLLSL